MPTESTRTGQIGGRIGSELRFESQGTGFRHLRLEGATLLGGLAGGTGTHGQGRWVQHASRDIVMITPGMTVVYDRVDTFLGGISKRFCWVPTRDLGSSVIRGNLVLGAGPEARRPMLQSLLPVGGTIYCLSEGAVVVEDPWNPSQVRFLHVEQEAEVGGSMARALRLQSAGGIPFDGVRIGAWAVFFRRGGESGEVATVLEVPAGVEQVLITGLAAKGSYPVREERSATGGWRIWIAGGGGALGLANDSGALSWHLPESI